MAARNPFASSVPDIYDPYASPYSRRAPLSTGYYFIRNLLIVGGVCGAFVAAYRNDVFLELSRRVGMESRYLAAEQYLIGTPGWGTPRSMGPVLNPSETTPASNPAEPASAPPAPSVHPEPVAAAPVPAAPTEERSHSPAAEPAPAPIAPTPAAAAPTAKAVAPVAARAAAADPLAPVSLDSLPVLGKGGAPVRTVAEAPASRPAAPAPVARSFAPAAAPAAVRPTPSPVPRANGKALKVSLDDEPSPAAATNRSIPAPRRAAAPPAPEPSPAPVAAKPAPPSGPKTTEVHKNDNPLMAAVRSAVRTRPPKESVPAAQ